MRYVASSDRNVYDRCIYQGVDHEADAYFITGLGVYPNLGRDGRVRDRAARRQAVGDPHVGRASRRQAEPAGRAVPHRGDRAVPRAAADLRRRRPRHRLRPRATGRSTDPISEPQHIRRQGDRILLDASRFAGVGTWEGELRVDGDTIAVTPDRYTATRDRSWGIRPGRRGRTGRPAERVHGHVVVLDPAALRRLRAARHPRRGPRRAAQHELRGARAGPKRAGRAPEQLGWPLPEIRYASGTRNPTGASIELTNRDGKKSTLEIEPIIGIPLNVGCGYGADPDWTHGLWKGDGWVEGSKYDYNDPAVTGRAAFSLWDHVARVTFEGHEGWGIFEHGCIGAHAPSGFTDLRRRRE